MPHYEFAPNPEGNSYIFLSNLGWLYTLTFRESADYFTGNEILYNNTLVFEISFSRSPSSSNAPKKGVDTYVKETIHSILYHHLQAQGHLPLYFFICYAADDKEAARLKLFTQWYESFDSVDWQLYNYELHDPDAIIYYGLFVNFNHPGASMIPVEFENFVQKEKNVWKELFRRR